MPRRHGFHRSCIGLGSALWFAAAASALPGFAQQALQQQSTTAPSAQTPALSVEQARAAATRVFDVIQRGDAKARYSQFSPEMQAVTSPSMIAATMRSQPKVLSYKLLSVQSSLNGSTVEADLTTTAGPRTVFLVLTSAGKIARYYFDRIDDSTSQVASQFMQALSTGHFITAHSFLSPLFQSDITPEALQSKWLGLQRETGAFVRLGRVVEAETTPDSRLVLVNVQFNRLTENVFVVLNNANQITGLDFPQSDQAP